MLLEALGLRVLPVSQVLWVLLAQLALWALWVLPVQLELLAL